LAHENSRRIAALTHVPIEALCDKVNRSMKPMSDKLQEALISVSDAWRRLILAVHFNARTWGPVYLEVALATFDPTQSSLRDEDLRVRKLTRL
jgi:hypothetical protein